MSTTRVFTRLAAFSAATVGAVLTSFALASPAYAADVEVRIGNFPGSITTGGQPRSFDGTTTNKDKQPVHIEQHVIVLRLNGLQPDQVKIAKGGISGGQQLQVEATSNGEVRAVDHESFDLRPVGQRDSVHRTRYWIAFMSDAPSGRADLTFGAQGGGNVLDTASRDFTVKGGSGQSTKTTAPPTSAAATGPGLIQTFPPGPSYSLAPLQESQGLTDEGSGVPLVFYIMGAILVAAGGGILWLLFRPRPELVDAAYDYAPANPAYPSNPNPTAIMPTVRDPRGMPQPGVDPWATQDSGATKDSTHDLGPFGHRH